MDIVCVMKYAGLLESLCFSETIDITRVAWVFNNSGLMSNENSINLNSPEVLKCLDTKWEHLICTYTDCLLKCQCPPYI